MVLHRSLRGPVAVTAICLASLSAGLLVGRVAPDLGVRMAAADDAAGQIPVIARAAFIDGKEVGEVVMNGRVVARIRSASGGMSASQRAATVAARLREVLTAETTPSQIRAARVAAMDVVMAGDKVLITAPAEDARALGTTRAALAKSWAQNMRAAVADYRAGGPVVVAAPPEAYDDKWVPIVSVLRGVRVGVARVNGPKSRVGKVQAVAQLETRWKDYVAVDVYLPISTSTPGEVLDRVEGVAVTGLGDFRL